MTGVLILSRGTSLGALRSYSSHAAFVSHVSSHPLTGYNLLQHPSIQDLRAAYSAIESAKTYLKMSNVLQNTSWCSELHLKGVPGSRPSSVARTKPMRGYDSETPICLTRKRSG